MPRLWWAQPESGDIVWCHFPQLPGLVPGPKPRPALVIEVRELAGGRYRAVVAYGTSKKVLSLHAGEFAITPGDGAAFKLSGLQASTKFSLQDTVELDFSDEWFKPPPHAPFGEMPKLGMLHPSLVQRAAAAWMGIGKK